MGRCVRPGRDLVGSWMHLDASLGRTSAEREEQPVGAPSVDPSRICQGMGNADVSACRVYAVLRHERRLPDSTVEVAKRRTAANVGNQYGSWRCAVSGLPGSRVAGGIF